MRQPGSRTGALPMTELPADFRAFHQLYRGRYIQWAELYLRSRAEAEDAVDAAFEQLYLAWATVLRQRNPNAYAWKVVKNRTIDHAPRPRPPRHRRRHRRVRSRCGTPRDRPHRRA